MKSFNYAIDKWKDSNPFNNSKTTNKTFYIKNTHTVAYLVSVFY